MYASLAPCLYCVRAFCEITYRHYLQVLHILYFLQYAIACKLRADLGNWKCLYYHTDSLLNAPSTTDTTYHIVVLLASEGDCKAAMFYTPVEAKFATVRTSLCARHDPVSTLLQIDISYTRIQPVSCTGGETRPRNTILCVRGKNYDSQTATYALVRPFPYNHTNYVNSLPKPEWSRVSFDVQCQLN
jgi:hypothetical protein